ncbi:MAG: hypothetical protein WC791_01940 [Candidatus Paceibacterota bacterium]|jgi:hypothetical protein
MKNNNKEIIKSERSRSGSFPTLSLEESIELMKKGASAGWVMSKDTFAKAIGGSTANSGAFLVKLAALRDFGLIERGGKVEYTQLAKEIVAPKTEDHVEIQNRLKESFLKSDAFKLLYEIIKDSTGESSFQTIANLGIHDFRISVTKKDLFAQNFISSVKYAGLMEESADGKIKVIKGDEVGQKEHKNNVFEFSDFGFSTKKDVNSQTHIHNDSGNGWVLTIKTGKPLTSDVKRKLIDVTELLEKLNEDK